MMLDLMQKYIQVKDTVSSRLQSKRNMTSRILTITMHQVDIAQHERLGVTDRGLRVREETSIYKSAFKYHSCPKLGRSS